MQACPLRPEPDSNGNLCDMEMFSRSYGATIKSVVSFAKQIPGFTDLDTDDQTILLRVNILYCFCLTKANKTHLVALMVLGEEDDGISASPSTDGSSNEVSLSLQNGCFDVLFSVSEWVF